MDVAKPYIRRVCNFHSVRERLIAAYDPVHVQVRDGDVAGIPNIERQSESALAPFLFRLQRINLPVGCVVQHYLVANVMLARQFINSPFARGVRDIQARLRERAGRPDVDESPAATDPQAGILSVPACGSVAAGLSSTSGRPARSRKRACISRTPRAKGEFMNCRASITFAT